jgi:hypothetical protein
MGSRLSVRPHAGVNENFSGGKNRADIQRALQAKETETGTCRCNNQKNQAATSETGQLKQEWLLFWTDTNLDTEDNTDAEIQRAGTSFLRERKRAGDTLHWC